MPNPAPSLWSQALRNPRSIASIAPSGQALASAMAAALPSGVDCVVELGPGTGPVTQAILDAGIHSSRLLIVEFNHTLGRALRTRFPGVPTAIADARFLPFVLRDMGWPSQIPAIISSLGLRAMTEEATANVLAAANSSLLPGGAFIQYAYAPSPPIPAFLVERLGWRHEKLGMVWRNLPPASIHRYWKPESSKL
jgi:phosphatidylethanolamine/phosphatidyl-N-methylethanolamine N-methyltransferase